VDSYKIDIALSKTMGRQSLLDTVKKAKKLQSVEWSNGKGYRYWCNREVCTSRQHLGTNM